MGSTYWGANPERGLAFWVLSCAFLFFLLGIVLYLLTGHGHFFAFGLLSVGLVGWLLGRRPGVFCGLGVAFTSTTLMLALGIDLDIVFRDNTMYLAMAVVLGAGVGQLADTNRALRAAQVEILAAQAEIKVLRGFIPICAHCKNVRDDRGFWTEVEDYVGRHSDAEFTHGFCPTCTEAMLADMGVADLGEESAVH